MISSTIPTPAQTKPSPGASPAILIQWQGRLYGPYANEAEMAVDGFRFDGGYRLINPLNCK